MGVIFLTENHEAYRYNEKILELIGKHLSRKEKTMFEYLLVKNGILLNVFQFNAVLNVVKYVCSNLNKTSFTIDMFATPGVKNDDEIVMVTVALALVFIYWRGMTITLQKGEYLDITKEPFHWLHQISKECKEIKYNIIDGCYVNFKGKLNNVSHTGGQLIYKK